MAKQKRKTVRQRVDDRPISPDSSPTRRRSRTPSGYKLSMVVDEYPDLSGDERVTQAELEKCRDAERALRANIEEVGELRHRLVARLLRGAEVEPGELTVTVTPMPRYALWRWVERALGATQPAYLRGDELDGEPVRLLIQGPPKTVATGRSPKTGKPDRDNMYSVPGD